MADQRASAHGQFLFVNKTGSYNVMLTCSWGDLYQRYDKSAGTCSPSFAGSTNPVYTMQVISSRSAENQAAGALALDTAKWYIQRQDGNNVVNYEIVFGADGVSTKIKNGATEIAGEFAGMFVRTLGSGKATLTIKKDMALLFDGKSTILTCTVEVSGTGESFTASSPITFTEGIAGTIDLFIIDSETNFTITKQPNTTGDGNDKVTLKTMLVGAENLGTPTWKWEQFVNGSFQTISGATASQLEVTAAMVDTVALFRVTATFTGNKTATDQQQVYDISDPYDVLVEFKKGTSEASAESISAPNMSSDDLDGTKVFFFPKIVEMGTSTQAVADNKVTWTYLFTDSAGIPLKWNDTTDHAHSEASGCTPKTSENFITKTEAQQAEVINWYITGKFTV